MTNRLTVQDCRDCGYCVKGIREHCSLLGVDFRRMVREGIPLTEIEGLDDAIAQKCIARARERELIRGK